ncbi:MAG: ATP-dependent helicase, partial [Planctomycetia bacterium]|nr:ATP-dependent helicase [Planctomycetia bacterium]
MSAALTPAQRRAVERGRGDACVLAGAGCGKTTVLTQRFVELVARHRLDPRRVAALTFTDQAAGEMRARIAAAFRA